MNLNGDHRKPESQPQRDPRPVRAHGLTIKSLLGVHHLYQSARICQHSRPMSSGLRTNSRTALKCLQTRPCCEGGKYPGKRTRRRGALFFGVIVPPVSAVLWFSSSSDKMVSHVLSAPHPYNPPVPLQPTTPRIFLKGEGGLQNEKTLKPSNRLGFWLFAVGNSGGGGGELTLEPK